ncbi:MAG: branched-chain amino acid ABC transporter permease [Alphaproteobacteria bacterium]|nr:branched-chain amino acid ABC transporter permease [Alphaproteobacteria bacterium]
MDGQLAYFAQQVLNALQLASFYVPLALAFALIQAITKRVFLSFGDITMFGSFAAVYMCFTTLLRGNDDLVSSLTGLVAALLCAGALGLVIARFVFKPLMSTSAQAFMITSVGLSIMLQEVMRLQSGGRDIWIPPLFQGLKLIISQSANLSITLINVFSVLVSVTVVTLVAFILISSRFGRNWRACAQEIALARLCGVNTAAVIEQSFMLGSALSATSGWIAAVVYGGTSFSSGMMLGFKAMFAAVIGGFSSVRGAVLGALSLAGLEVVWSAFFGSTYRDVGVFAIIICILLLRPEGLAGLSAQRESELR